MGVLFNKPLCVYNTAGVSPLLTLGVGGEALGGMTFSASNYKGLNESAS